MKDKVFEGRGLSAGIGIGPVSVLPDFNYEMEEVEIHPDAVERELERFNQALEQARDSTEQLISHVDDTLFEDLSDLFHVQVSLLGDPSFTSQVVKQIKQETLCAESAVMKAMKSLEEGLDGDCGDGRTRSIDFLDAGMRVLGHLEAPVSHPRLPHGGILVARRIAPSVAVYLEEYEIEGLVVGNTDRSSHIAVVAQCLEIPTVGLLDDDFYNSVEVGKEAVVSANQSRVYLEPSQDTIETHQDARERFCQFSNRIQEKTRDIDPDSLTVRLRGNLGLMEEIPLLEKYGGEGSGLVRTEFLFLGHTKEIPEEAVQGEMYHRMAEFIAPDPVRLRTFDFGGDKVTLKEPDDVGGRGIYRELYNRPVLRTQLSAMCRAYQEYDNINVLLPLVGSVKEVREVHKILDEFSREKDWELPPLGIMVEIPAVLFALDELLPLVDFLSLGTNDLQNYLVGSDRFGTPGADSVNYPDPALFEFISRVVEKVKPTDVPLGLCGEIGSNPIFTPVLIGLGLDEISMAPMRLPEVKLVAANCPVDEAERLAEEALAKHSRDEIKSWVREELGPFVQEILRESEIPRESREFDYYERN